MTKSTINIDWPFTKKKMVIACWNVAAILTNRSDLRSLFTTRSWWRLKSRNMGKESGNEFETNLDKSRKRKNWIEANPVFSFLFFYYPSSFEWEQVNNRYEGFLFFGEKEVWLFTSAIRVGRHLDKESRWLPRPSSFDISDPDPPKRRQAVFLLLSFDPVNLEAHLVCSSHVGQSSRNVFLGGRFGLRAKTSHLRSRECWEEKNNKKMMEKHTSWALV